MTSKYFTCKNCHENTKVKSMATDRVEMERDLGETFLAACGHCHDRKTIHVNDVNAEPNKLITVMVIIASVVAGIAAWQLGAMARGDALAIWEIRSVAISAGALPLIFHTAQRKAAATFNGYKIRPTK